MAFNLIIQILVSLIIIVCSYPIFPQQYKIEGRIFNKSTNSVISYANLRAESTTKGTSSDVNGHYLLNLPPGNYNLVASCIGFQSDTIKLEVTTNIKGINFYLIPTSIHLPEVTIVPGKNPALAIMEKAILKKEQRASQLNSYEYDAYTKGVIKSNTDMNSSEGNQNSVNVSVKTGKDSQDLRINAIFENQSKGFFKKPNKYKELIIARKQTANIPSSINAVTGGRLIQNFYSDDLKFFNRPMSGPLSKNALTYYYFRIDDTTAIDNRKVFKIYFEPDNNSDPGFVGYVYITDSTYDMIRINADLNRAANTGGIFQRVNIFQQFLPYDSDTYMPIDYRLFIRADILGFAKVGFELSSVLNNYRINEAISDSIFDKAILTVVPGADNKDSTYWTAIQTIPNSIEEIVAYRKIDSAASAPISIWRKISSGLLGSHIQLNDHLSVSGPLGLFRFNRVEGWALNFNGSAIDMADKRFNTDLSLSYGFSDKKFKQTFSANYYLGEYRTYKLSFTGYNNIASLFASSDAYNEFTSTLLALLAKYDFRDYYYTKGFNFQAEGEIFPILKLSAGFTNRTDNSAKKNSEYSFFAKDKSYSNNPPIYETRINQINIGFNLDFRNYIEDGFFRRRVSEGKPYILFSGGLEISDSKLLRSSLNFKIYNANIQGSLNTFGYANLSYRIHGTYSNGPVPYQMQYALAGNISATGKNFTFRTVGISEVFADRVVTLNIEHNFRDELFRLLRVPVLEDLELQLDTFFNAGWTNMSEKSKEIIPIEYTVLGKPLFEVGFNIGHVLFPISIELAWRLTHRENNSFVIGINTVIL